LALSNAKMRGNSTSEKAMKSSFEMEAGRKNFIVTVTALFV
jgi:hypothetical protein